ncbi:MAG: TerD family protein [Alphaproteobacteria bacterium]|nr:TerD family protein [Alphaproteobacteria bacterium]
MVNTITKGQKAPLNHTKKARERIVVGLSWDARQDKVNMVRGLLKTDSQHDLDITCYIYNSAREFIDFVGAEAQDSMDQSGKIYHSGDDMTGAGDGDDEFISAELAGVPEDVHAIVFLVEIRSRHTFSDVETPFTRLADGMTDTNLLEIPINHDEAHDKNAFVMCAISRNQSSPTGWMVYNISEYPDISKITDWGTYLAQFVD